MSIIGQVTMWGVFVSSQDDGIKNNHLSIWNSSAADNEGWPIYAMKTVGKNAS